MIHTYCGYCEKEQPHEWGRDTLFRGNKLVRDEDTGEAKQFWSLDCQVCGDCSAWQEEAP